MSAEQLQELADARRRGAKVRRAISVAKFDAWTVAIFAGFTLMGVPFGSVVCGVLGTGMAIVAFVEFKGIERLRRLDPTVAKTLALNQVGLGLLLLGYAAYSIATAGSGMGGAVNVTTPGTLVLDGASDRNTQIAASAIGPQSGRALKLAVNIGSPVGDVAAARLTCTPTLAAWNIAVTLFPVVSVTVRGPSAAPAPMVMFAVADVALLTVKVLTEILAPKLATVVPLAKWVDVPVMAISSV